MVTSLRHGNTVATDQEGLTHLVDDYYSSLFGRSESRAHTLKFETLQLPRLDLAHLEEPFTEDEVHAVVKAMPLDKAPDLDGFTGRFYAVC